MNKLSNYRFAALALLCCAAMQLHAQDPRERYYYYEVLEPKHEYKPKVDGYAAERITEKLNRGLTAVPAKDGKSVYLSWRLLASDGDGAAFHVYRKTGGKTKRLSR